MAKRGKRGISLLLVAVMVLFMTGQHILPVRAEEDSGSNTGTVTYIYQAEDYYPGNISEEVAADMQPGESITITLGDDFVAGRYDFSVYSCGNRESFTVKVNGATMGTLTRTGTGFGQDEMTLDSLGVELSLEVGMELTIVAPDDGSYGWVDYLQLDKVSYYTYQAEDYYGSSGSSTYADMQPGESITIAFSANSDFEAGTYTLSVHSCGNRESFEVLVSGTSVGTISRTGTGFGLDQMTLDALGVELTLGTGDTLTITAPDDGSYGWVDYLRLYPVSSDEESGEGDTEEPSEGDTEEPSEDDTEEASEGDTEEPSEEESESSSEEPSEEESESSSEEPGEEESESPSEEPSEEESESPSEEPSEEESESPSEEPSEDDSQSMPTGATETGDGYFVYQAEYYYDGDTVNDGTAADMQPDESIDFAVSSNSDFTSGTYVLTIYSCGNREEFYIYVNGKSVGTITRTGTGFGGDQMTYDVLDTELKLNSGDVVTITAQSGSYWGWVDFIILSEEDADTSDAGTSGSGSSSSGTGGSDTSGSGTSGSGSSGSGTSNSGSGSTAVDGATETGDGYYVYQMEYFYDGDMIYNDGGEAYAADMQPGESIAIDLSTNSDFASGTYTLTIYSCGNREKFQIYVNGKLSGTLTRTGTGFGQDQMTYDLLGSQLDLDADDVITIVAQSGDYWGWVDFMILSTEGTDAASAAASTASGSSSGSTSYATSGAATESYDSYLVYQAEYYYGQVVEDCAADLQPGDSIDINVSSNSGFTAGAYTLTVYSCGNREEFDIQVNGVSVGTITRSGTGFGLDQMTYDKLTTTVLDLKENDVISLVGQSGEYYGWVDFMILDRGDTRDSDLSSYSSSSNASYTVSGAATEAYDTYLIYQAEYYYDQVVEDCAADLQPGDSININVSSNAGFTAGTYTLTVYSCGNREEFDIQVNGVSVGTINRSGTGFGLDQMTYDKLTTTVLDLEENDVISLVGQSGEYYGWVDFIILDRGDTRDSSSSYSSSSNASYTVSGAATEAYDTYLIYQAEYYYDQVVEDAAADLQPGDSIDINVSTNAGFTPGTYTLTVYSCGNREEFDIQVNGVSIGTITREGTGFGLDQMTYDKLTASVLELEENDVISLVGQSGEYYGWVDFIILDKGDTRDGAVSMDEGENLIDMDDDETQDDTTEEETGEVVSEEGTEGTGDGSGNSGSGIWIALAAGVGVILVGSAAVSAVVFARRRRKGL